MTLRLRTRLGLVLGAFLLLAPLAAARAASPFDGWAAAVVAADFKGSNGGDTEAFDNARRDIAAMLVKLGFSPGNVLQFSTRPARYPDQTLEPSALAPIRAGLTAVAQRASAGCLLYLTSHGVPGAIVMAGEPRGMVTPGALDQMIAAACPGRPAIVVLSACFSGSFIPGMARNDRMILTAARPDRSSFGCGESDRYPYFDACILEQGPQSKTFVDLAQRAATCVAAKELETGARPPSEPQLWMGPAIKPLLPLYAFPSG